MSLADLMAADAALFTNAADFGEAVVYRKRSGATRTINAVVERFPPPAPGEPAAGPKMRVTVANSTTTGIAASELDVGGDKIVLAYRPGTAAAAYLVAIPAGLPEWHDAGMVSLDLN